MKRDTEAVERRGRGGRALKGREGRRGAAAQEAGRTSSLSEPGLSASSVSRIAWGSFDPAPVISSSNSSRITSGSCIISERRCSTCGHVGRESGV